MKRFFFPFVLLVLLSTCIDPYGFNAELGEQALAVEGYITTIPGHQEIRLRRAEVFGPDYIGINRPEGLATVLIKDDLGRVTRLVEQEQRGLYLTEEIFAAETGRSYNLEIITQNKKRYISKAELVREVPKLDSVTYRAVRIPSTDLLNDDYGVQVLGHFQDPKGQDNYYFWRTMESDFVLIAEPDLENIGGGPAGLPPCPPCCEKICYHKDLPKPGNIFTVDDTEFDGLYQSRVIAFVEDNGLRFKDTYRLELQHMSVTQETQRYLQLIDQQLRLTGSVFDPPPANIRGNMISLDDPDELVLGQFFAVDIEQVQVYIQKSKLEFFRRPQTIVPRCCIHFLYQDPRTGYVAPLVPTTPPSDWNPPRD
ncbi:DUF4249 domain-containing protein [Arthrospiribacter ruber]|uniref:DUF4249 domain-containing protein n=1 Tax=Arthrospiribacter ruber TaxID=2487934 RepID=A0A951IZT2_9BACT|nr:DUF4249 domain-containing protein [Arthrospiribacter ruber]MBW3468901.1 DUF4249 domain-containing protein [Arthrospiribacter ruber]